MRLDGLTGLETADSRSASLWLKNGRRLRRSEPVNRAGVARSTRSRRAASSPTTLSIRLPARCRVASSEHIWRMHHGAGKVAPDFHEVGCKIVQVDSRCRSTCEQSRRSRLAVVFPPLGRIRVLSAVIATEQEAQLGPQIGAHIVGPQGDRYDIEFAISRDAVAVERFCEFMTTFGRELDVLVHYRRPGGSVLRPPLEVANVGAV